MINNHPPYSPIHLKQYGTKAGSSRGWIFVQHVTRNEPLLCHYLNLMQILVYSVQQWECVLQLPINSCNFDFTESQVNIRPHPLGTLTKEGKRREKSVSPTSESKVNT